MLWGHVTNRCEKKKESPAYMKQEKRRERYEEKKNSDA
jgi:hypothetical protein